MTRADARVALRPELGPGPEQREVDVEEDGPAARATRIRQTPRRRAASSAARVDAATRSDGGRGREQRRGAASLRDVPRRRRGLPRRESAPADSRLAEIGVPRFELGTSPTRTERATRLRHTPSATRVAVPPFRPRRLAADGAAGRDRRVRERAARDRAVPGVRAAGAPGRRRARGDDDRVRRLVLARALRARGGARRRARAGAPRALLAQRAARRRRTAARPPRGALSRRRVARRLPPRARRAPDARQQRAARRTRRGDARRPVRGRGARLHDRRSPRRTTSPRASPARSGAHRSCSAAATDEIRRLAVSTGAAGHDLVPAAHEGYDALLTGEPEEPSAATASELGIHLLAAGHHASEQFGVQALAAHLADRFELEWHFVEVANPV